MNDVFGDAYWDQVNDNPEAGDLASPDGYLDRVIDPAFGRPYLYDRKGKPISMREWGVLHEGEPRKGSKRYVRVRQDFVGRYHVSTVWLGMDHGLYNDGPPVIFETMVFERRLERGLFGLYHPEAMDINVQWRYSTEEEALAGHYEIRRLVRREMHALNGPQPLPARVRRGLS